MELKVAVQGQRCICSRCLALWRKPQTLIVQITSDVTFCSPPSVLARVSSFRRLALGSNCSGKLCRFLCETRTSIGWFTVIVNPPPVAAVWLLSIQMKSHYPQLEKKKTQQQQQPFFASHIRVIIFFARTIIKNYWKMCFSLSAVKASNWQSASTNTAPVESSISAHLGAARRLWKRAGRAAKINDPVQRWYKITIYPEDKLLPH